MDDRISEAQQRTLRELSAFITRTGYPPTMSELGEVLGITAASAHNLVKQLERKGFVRRQPNRPRSLQVVREPEQSLAALVSVPVVGAVKAGPAMLAEENRLGTIMLPRSTVGTGKQRGRLFALRVTGDSMIDAGIRDGDFVIVRQQPIAESGEIIVALVDGAATVKRLHISDESIELRAANEAYAPIVVQPDSDFRVLGKLVNVTSHED